MSLEEGHSNHRLVERGGGNRATEARVTEVEDTPVGGRQCVSLSKEGAAHPYYRPVEMLRRGRAIELCVAEGEHTAIASGKGVAVRIPSGRNANHRLVEV